ncbi:hypothetical protein O181_066566 [Austropuccinia psidii MF-1]|uniref:Uncharacterized protein n=1 Tax=Austropuccinia psidii MF-1 TaxID=1389203 RepID=A0A9Q3EXX8_9BASI|nr:hypothetical protein [Austropuccinia psidii MF-1]
MPELSNPSFHIRIPVEPNEKMTNTFIKDLSHQDNNKVLMKEEPQLKKWEEFTGEGEYEHMPFIKTIDIFQEEYSIPDVLITERSHSSLEKSEKRWYYGIRQTNGKHSWSWWKNEIITK